MPSASIETDGTLSMGYSYDSPYSSYWSSLSVFPFLQLTGRYIGITGTPQFRQVENNPYWKGYGKYKDKVVDAKLRFVEEGAWTPAVSLGEIGRAHV